MFSGFKYFLKNRKLNLREQGRQTEIKNKEKKKNKLKKYKKEDCIEGGYLSFFLYQITMKVCDRIRNQTCGSLIRSQPF